MKKFLVTNWAILLKWFAILVITSSIILLILTFTKSLGFSTNMPWETHSGDSILGDASTSKGPGPLQMHTMQVLIAFFGGGAIGVAGSLLQKVTKNRLAEVSILGIGSLNIFFIYLYAVLLKDKAYGETVWAHLMPIFLILVSVIGTTFVWLISRSKHANKNTFVIVGIALQLLVEALSVIVVNPKQLASSSSSAESKAVWGKIQGYTLGQIRSGIKSTYPTATSDTNPVPWWLIIVAICLITTVLAAIFFLRRRIDTYETSEELSTSTGINTKWLRFIIYILVAVLAGTSSAILGTVALLGIIAPSIARMLFKNKMLPVMIASFLIGGLMVGFASWLSMNMDLRLPVGILSTAIVIPYFIYQMIRER